MLTGWPPATGFAAPDRMHALGEQLGRPEIGRQHGGGRRPELTNMSSCRLLDSVAPGRVDRAKQLLRAHARETWVETVQNGTKR
eukprot:6509687-Prymnesium_polylepis.1